MHDALRQHIRKSLTGDFPAHASFQDAVANWPHEQRGMRPEGLPYSGWELVEHIRLAQADLLRSALMVLDHNAYHVGQLVTVRRLLNCWPPADTA